MEYQIPDEASPLVSAWHILSQNHSSQDPHQWRQMVMETVMNTIDATFLGTLCVDNVYRYRICLDGQTTPATWTPRAGWDIAAKLSWGGENHDILLVGCGGGEAIALSVRSVSFVSRHWQDLSWFFRLGSTKMPTMLKSPPTSSQLARQITQTQTKSPRNLLELSLEKLTTFLETQRPDLFAAVMLYRSGHLTIAAAPSLPADYQKVINGLQVGPRSGSCGTAGYFKRPIYVADIAHDPRWQSVQWIGPVYGLASCWSIPLLNAQGVLLGTFSCYCPEPRYPSPQDLEWMYLIRDWVLEALYTDRQASETLEQNTDIPALTLRHDHMGRVIEVVDPGFLEPAQAQQFIGVALDGHIHPREIHRIKTVRRELSTTGMGHALFRVRYDTKDLRAKYHWVQTDIVAEEEDIGQHFRSTTRELTTGEVKELLVSGEMMVDPITDLPVLGFWATDALDFSRQFQHVALMVVEIDHYDLFSMAVGQSQSARTLQALVTNIRYHLPARAIIAQINEYRLGVLISDPTPGTIPTLFHDANDALRHRNQEWVPTISAGIIHVEYREDQMDHFLHQAVVALKEAQTAGGEQYRYYEPLMDATRLQSATLEHDLRQALGRGELSLVYQPIASTKTWQIEGFEALVRWTHGARGPIGPTDFIPIAERSGAILEIGAWVLEESLRQVKQWQHITQNDRLYVHVNVSARQLEDPRFPAIVLDTLAKTHFAASQLKLEITESMLVKDLAGVLETMHQLRQVGISWSLDDFGTGYSSLAALGTLPIQVLKIDRSFVSSLHDKPTRAIVKTLIHLAKALKLSIIAEGVEDDDEWAQLDRMGCFMLQGFLISRPLEPKGALALLQRGIRPIAVFR